MPISTCLMPEMRGTVGGGEDFRGEHGHYDYLKVVSCLISSLAILFLVKVL